MIRGAENSAKALKAFRRAASLGDVLASYKLGCFYAGQEGDLVENNPDLALRYKLVAAEAGYALAQQNVAAHYTARDNIPVALSWLEKAAGQGWPDALATYASVHNERLASRQTPRKQPHTSGCFSTEPKRERSRFGG